MKKIIAFVLICTLFTLFLTSCEEITNNIDTSFEVTGVGGEDFTNSFEPTQTEPEPIHTVVVDNEAHYLIFLIENQSVEKMLVVSSDTYENLSPYFPTIPEKPGYSAYWEEKEVYSDDQKEIYITAYYFKKG